MALTELQIRQVKPKEKRFSLSDGRGLLLEIHPNGAKYWICRVKVNGKEKRKTFECVKFSVYRHNLFQYL